MPKICDISTPPINPDPARAQIQYTAYNNYKWEHIDDVYLMVVHVIHTILKSKGLGINIANLLMVIAGDIDEDDEVIVRNACESTGRCKYISDAIPNYTVPFFNLRITQDDNGVPECETTSIQIPSSQNPVYEKLGTTNTARWYQGRPRPRSHKFD